MTERFVQVLAEPMEAVRRGIPHPAVNLLLHLVCGADYRTHVYDARSVYELAEAFGFSDSVTRRHLEGLEERGYVERLAGTKGILVPVMAQIIRCSPEKAGSSPEKGQSSPEKAGFTPLRGVRPAETDPYIRSERKDPRGRFLPGSGWIPHYPSASNGHHEPIGVQ